MDKNYLMTKPGHGWVIVDKEILERVIGKASTEWAEERLGEEGCSQVKVHTFAIRRGPNGWDEQGDE